MTDRQWHSKIVKSVTLLRQSLAIRREIEEEYKARYGNYPSDVNDDWWIDGVHYGTGNIELDKIKESAESHKNNQ